MVYFLAVGWLALSRALQGHQGKGNVPIPLNLHFLLPPTSFFSHSSVQEEEARCNLCAKYKVAEVFGVEDIGFSTANMVRFRVVGLPYYTKEAISWR